MRSIRFLLIGLAAAAVVASFAACDGQALTREAHPTTLAGSAWQVLSVNGRSPVPGAAPTAVFTAVEVTGSAGCNHYGGRYVYDPATGAISLQDLGMTAMACVEPAKNEFEAVFSQALAQATTVSVDPDGRLVLTGKGGEIVLAVAAVGG